MKKLSFIHTLFLSSALALSLYLPALRASQSGTEEDADKIQMRSSNNIVSPTLPRGTKRKRIPEALERSFEKEAEACEKKKQKTDNASTLKENNVALLANKRWVGGPQIGTEDNELFNNLLLRTMKGLIFMHKVKDKKPFPFVFDLMKALENNFKTPAFLPTLKALENSYHYLSGKNPGDFLPYELRHDSLPFKPRYDFLPSELFFLAEDPCNQSERELVSVIQYISGIDKSSDLRFLKSSPYSHLAMTPDQIELLKRRLNVRAKRSSLPLKLRSPKRNIQEIIRDLEFILKYASPTPDECYNTAVMHFDAGNKSRALELLEKLFKDYPLEERKIEYYQGGIILYFYAKKFKRAAKLSEELFKHYSNAVTADDLRKAIAAHSYAGNFPRALKLSETLFKRLKNQPNAITAEDLRRANVTYFYTRDFKGAIEFSEVLFKHYSNELEADDYRRAIMLYLEIENFKHAVAFSEKFLTFLKDHPNEFVATDYQLVAEAFEKAGDKKRAAEYSSLYTLMMLSNMRK